MPWIIAALGSLRHHTYEEPWLIEAYAAPDAVKTFRAVVAMSRYAATIGLNARIRRQRNCPATLVRAYVAERSLAKYGQ